MPNHSESYLRRRDNPKGRFKPESEHIQHVQHRMKERFGEEITVEEYYKLLADIQSSGKRIYGISSNAALYEFVFRDKLIWFLYGYNDDRVPPRIKTVLRPYDQYVVPNKLGDLYDHREFTAEIDKFLKESVELAAELDLNDKKSFFLKEGFSQIMKSASLNYKLEGKITFKMVGMACKSIVYRHYPDDSE